MFLTYFLSLFLLSIRRRRLHRIFILLISLRAYLFPRTPLRQLSSGRRDGCTNSYKNLCSIQITQSRLSMVSFLRKAARPFSVFKETNIIKNSPSLRKCQLIAFYLEITIKEAVVDARVFHANLSHQKKIEIVLLFDNFKELHLSL